MLTHKDMEAIEDLLCEEVKKVVKKGEIKDANEAKGLKDCLEGIKIVHCLRDGSVNDEGYSGYYPHMHNRVPTNYSGTVDFDGSYSGRRMPNFHTMERGYSGHSINDRMIAELEKLYDEAKTEHERMVIGEEIAHLKSK